MPGFFIKIKKFHFGSTLSPFASFALKNPSTFNFDESSLHVNFRKIVLAVVDKRTNKQTDWRYFIEPWSCVFKKKSMQLRIIHLARRQKFPKNNISYPLGKFCVHTMRWFSCVPFASLKLTSRRKINLPWSFASKQDKQLQKWGICVHSLSGYLQINL